MDWSTWRIHFEANRGRPDPELGPPPALTAARARAIARSLAHFQLGEAGEGRIAHQIDGVMLPAIDDNYRAALKLFVAEEGRHARWLALMVRKLGGALVEHHWTNRLFVHGRRLLGLRLKIVVLLTAEVLGLTFYALLAEALPPGPLRGALGDICVDEAEHLRFHADFLRTQAMGLGGLALRAALWLVCGAAVLTVAADHRATLRTLRIPLRRVVHRAAGFTRAADAHIYGSSPGDARAMPSRRLSSRAA